MAEIDVDSCGTDVILKQSVPTQKIKIKQAPMRKNFFFTYNNYDEGEIDVIVNTLKKFAYKGKIQSEVGAEGTPHLQGQIWCEKQHRDSEFKLSKKIHWETLRDIENKRDYCGKSETHDGKVRVEWGFPKPIKIIEELRPWQKEVEKIIQGEVDERKIYWFYEEKGNTGKSALVKYLVIKYNCLFCQGGKESDIMNLVFNTDMDKSNCVIFDLPRAHKGNISYASIENIKNGLICNTKYETGFKVFNAPHIIIFANYLPAKPEELSADRWDIKNINDMIYGVDVDEELIYNL